MKELKSFRKSKLNRRIYKSDSILCCSYIQGTLLNPDDLEDDVLIKTVIAGSSLAQVNMLIKEATGLHGMVRKMCYQ